MAPVIGEQRSGHVTAPVSPPRMLDALDHASEPTADHGASTPR